MPLAIAAQLTSALNPQIDSPLTDPQLRVGFLKLSTKKIPHRGTFFVLNYATDNPSAELLPT